MYHQVGDFRPMVEHRSTYCHHKRFALQMRFLKLFGFQVISLDQALQGLKGGGRLPRRGVVLTFDDGYADLKDYVTPVLMKYRFPATIYLLSGLIGQRAQWFSSDNRETPLLLDAPSIETLMSEGFDFGSHGVKHVKLAHIEHGHMRDEIRRSKQDLEALLGREVRHFCYPYGSYDALVIQEVRRAGYHTAVTCLRAAATPLFDPLELPRKAISYGDSLLGFMWKLFFKNVPKSQPVLQAGGPEQTGRNDSPGERAH